MCLIIKKPAGRQIATDFLANAWQHNSHGWGSFHVQRGQLIRSRGMAFEELVDHNAGLPDDTEVYVHLRHATRGAICPDMAHPYVVRDGLMLMHNGTLTHLALRDAAVSDTCEFAALLRDMLSGLSDAQAAALIRSQGFSRLLAPMVDGSMVVLLDEQGAVRLGRGWHQLQPGDWHDTMTGLEVSNDRRWSRLHEVAAPLAA
ncbi:hypothetical protein C7444_114119 [Sphaerotilus hippei]|uniref:Glutamine amidotransferase type-2 domain-containing protein n=1 Tax=Sphaerotilus hippei TaxID=744406 RepID=A0A318H1K9_9BURK|nr:hypothetical protein [Sphaerotilus hippei]PXW94420.1 hypothetical protein C7444_114119 [Sphaerotilus hippei]